MAVPNLGGYDYNFVEEPPDDLICLICTSVAKDPQQLSCCGKIFCRVCLAQNRIAGKNDCPQCRNNYQSFPDIRSDRQIKQLAVKCDSNGCNWTGELRAYEQHLGQCSYASVVCELCSQPVARGVLDNHVNNSCPNRVVKCQYCQEEGRFCTITTKSHLDTCPKVKINCPNKGCSAYVPRIEIVKHRGSCPYEFVQCKYQSLGCSMSTLRKDRESHEKDTQLHFRLAMETVTALEGRVKYLESSPREQKQQTVFKMQNYSTYKKEQNAFYSPPFFSHPMGYKMCIKVNPTGSSVGFSTHVSVHVFFMRGHNDDNLSWPFRGKVTIELLNQSGDKDHHVQSLIYNDSKDDADNKRVEGRERSTSGFGKPKFISHTALEKSAFLQNDSLYFRVSTMPATTLKPWLNCTV